MKNKTIKKLVIENIILLFPLILYAIYKNGILIYNKGLIEIYQIFKVLYLIGISVFVKFIIDLIKAKKIVIDYNLLYVILIAMIMPYNINILVYFISFTSLYIISLIFDKCFKINKVCYIYLIIILINSLFYKFTFLNPLEAKFNFSFTIFDYFLGKNIGGIASTWILFSLLAYLFNINNIYYKKDIPFIINSTYLILAFIYYLLTKDFSLIINSELIFASIFVCSLPNYSPYKVKHQIIYSILIAIITFIISVFYNKILAVYIATMLISFIFGFLNKNKKVS